MTLFDILIVLGVFIFFGYIIFAKMHSNNPELIDKIKGWMERKKEIKIKPNFTQQVHVEKRELI